MTKIRLVQNERSWAITLISQIDAYLASKTLRIKRADGERTVNTGNKRMFPDVLIYGDEDKHLLVQGWEVKMPDVPITDNDFFQDSRRKAINLNLNSFFMWNFSHGKLFLKKDGKFIEDKIWDLSKDIKTREDVETYKDLWMKTIEEALLYINAKLENKTLVSSTLGDIISSRVLNDIINQNKSISAENLKTASLKNATMRVNLNQWWDEVKLEYLKEEKDMYKAFSRTTILGWLNRILFAHVIKQFHSPAAVVETLDYSTPINDAVHMFAEITKQCDFYNVFSVPNYSEFIADETWRDIIEFNNFLKSSNISEMEHESFQNILEGSVTVAKREVLGQYTTPEKLAKILVGITINDITGNFIDPCCGTGTIPVVALKSKRELLGSVKALETTWCSDKQSFPLQIASVNFTDSHAMNIPSRIFQHDVLGLHTDNIVIITNPADGSDMEFKIPEFDTIASNLPFVSANTESVERKSLIVDVVDEVYRNTGVKLSGRNDLYAYIIFKLWHNLKLGGRLGVITSNSWFGTESGRQLFKALQFYYKIDGLYISGHGKWFNNAEVIAAMLILEKKPISPQDGAEKITFGTINEQLNKITDEEIVKLINNIIVKSCSSNDTLTLNNYFASNVEDLLNMDIRLNSLFGDIDWLLEIKSNFVKLSDFYEVYRGSKTGQDEIFILPDDVSIDEEFITVGLKNVSSVSTLICTPDTRILTCPLTYEELRSSNYSKTFEWFDRFKSNLNVSLLQRKKQWTFLDPSKLATLFTGMNPHERLFFGKFNSPTFINQRLIGLMPKNQKINNDLNHALLNSLVGMFYIEAIGFGRGQGVLDFSKDNLEKINFLNPNLLSDSSQKKIMDAFQPLLNRNIMRTEDELLSADRINFDKTVLEAYGILSYYERIKDSLLKLQRNRISVAKK